MGPLPLGAAVGNGPRGLFREWHLLGILPARSCAKPNLSLGRRRIAGDLRPRGTFVLRPLALERSRRDSEGASFWADQSRGQSWGRPEGVLLLSGRDPDALLPQSALQVSAEGLPLSTALGGEPPARAREPEYELLDTGVFDQSRYFDIQV